MATGYDWDANWTAVITAETLTEGGTISNNGEANEIDLDNKAACLLSFSASYSNHAKATSGLTFSVRRDVDDTLWETIDSASLPFEMAFIQNSDSLKTIALSAAQFQKFVIQADWGNTTGSSDVTYSIKAKFATIPAA
jgi:hypothetical protein